MESLNLSKEVLENAIGVHRTFEKTEPLQPIDIVAVQAMEELLKYKNAEEQGLLLRLPCKIGATVYYIEDNEINKFVVYSFDTRPLQQFVCNYEGIRLNFKNFGKTVFLTQAEAEQKLKEVEI